MMEAYKAFSEQLQPVISIYPGFLNLKLYDVLYRVDEAPRSVEYTESENKVWKLLKENGPMKVKDLQCAYGYSNRSRFLKDVINPMIERGDIYRDGSTKSPTAVIKIKR